MGTFETCVTIFLTFKIEVHVKGIKYDRQHSFTPDSTWSHSEDPQYGTITGIQCGVFIRLDNSSDKTVNM